MDNETIVYKLTLEDFELVANKKLTDDEKQLILRKFSIDDWYEIVLYFLQAREIIK
jgi:hypothetical protein